MKPCPGCIRLIVILCLASLCGHTWITAAVDPLLELHELRDEAKRLAGEGKVEKAMAAFETYEARARAAEKPFLVMGALWRQAILYSDQGELERTIECYIAAMEAVREAEADEHFGRTFWSQRFLIRANLITTYRARGQMGEALRTHRAGEEDYIKFFREYWETDIRPDPAGLILETGAHSKGIDLYLMSEADFRFFAGETDSALTLTQGIIDRHERKSRSDSRSQSALAQAYSNQIYRLHRIGENDAAMALSDKLLALEGGPGIFLDQTRERVRAAFYRILLGEPLEPQVERAEEAMESLREHGDLGFWLDAARFRARIHILQEETERGFLFIDEIIEKARETEYLVMLAKSLLLRAEMRLDVGRSDGVEADLVEALELLRQMGRWRLEVEGYALYAQYLLAEGRLDRANEISDRGRLLAEQFDEPVWEKTLSWVRADLPQESSSADVTAPLDPGLWMDLQPVKMKTEVMEGELARGRFVITNPGTQAVDGMLTIRGQTAANLWDAEREILAIEINPEIEPNVFNHSLHLEPKGDAAVYLQTTPLAGNTHGRVTLRWTGASEQTAIWEFDVNGPADMLTIVTDSLAMENLFYPVPLYQEVYYRGVDSAVQSVRVRTDRPCRVEILDHREGRLIGVDSGGDGDFAGVGDILFRDDNGDGFPDLKLSASDDVGALMLFVFPAQGYTSDAPINIETDLLVNGSWRLAGTSRLVPVPDEERQ